MKKIIALLLTVTLIISSVSVFSADADYVGAKLIGKEVITGTNSTTVDVEVEFTTAGVTSFDMVYFKAIPDEGLTMKSVTLPEEYTQYEDLKDDSYVKNNIIWMSQDAYETEYVAAPTATFVITYEIADPSIEKTYNIDICEELVDLNYGECTDITVVSDASVTVKSSDATLSDLTVDGATVEGFASDVYDYTITVPNSTTAVTVDAVAANEEAVATVSELGDLVVGDNAVTIDVLAADGKTTLTYTVNIVREGSDDATLSELVVGEYSFDLSTGSTEFIYGVANDVTEVEITAVATHEKANVVINGGKDLVVGENEATVTVTAENGETQLVYNITIVREASDDATLSELIVGGYSFDLSTGSTEFIYGAANDVTEVDITATATHEKANVVINGGKDLVVGENEATVTVTAENGETQLVYSITIVREASNDATLKNIKLFGTTIEGFTSDVYEYEIYVKNGLKSIELTAEATHENAQVVIEGTEGLAIGDNLVTITVTAEDGETQLTYNINVYRFEAEAVVGKADIDEAQYKAYTAEAAEGIVTITMDALAKHENADGVEGYWTGFGITAPDGAAYVKTATGTTADLTLGELTPVTAGEVVSFIVDAEAEEINKYVLVQWFDADEEAITYEAAYEMDITNITFADIILENGVNAEISKLEAKASMGIENGVIYTVKITDAEIADLVPVAYIDGIATGALLKSTETGKYVIIVTEPGEVVFKAIDASEATVTEFIYGDADDTGVMNANDAQALKRRTKGIKDTLTTIKQLVASDVNIDGEVNPLDITAMTRAIKSIKQLPALSK